jgi:hypothetical protein
VTVKLSRVPPMLPGQYSKRASGTVAVACPCCAMVTVLDHPYRISDAGIVTPSWLCSVCNWGGVLELVDFAEAVIT